MSSDPDQPEPGFLAPELLDDEPARRPRRVKRGSGHTPGTEDGRGHRMRWLGAAVALALVVGVAGWYADHRVRTDEAAAVLHCERRLSTASVLSELRMGRMVNYVRPATPAATGTRQLHLADLMASPAGEVLPLVQRANRICRAVDVRPWHFSLVARRNAASAYAGALVTLLQAVASQGSASFRHDETLVRLREAAGLD
jgi:hypothetical protein